MRAGVGEVFTGSAMADVNLAKRFEAALRAAGKKVEAK
jgi:hypothetical protein